MYAPVRTVAPTVSPISFDDLVTKTHLKVDSADEENIVSLYIDAAVSLLDGWTGILGRALVQQTWRQDFDDFAGRLPLPLSPGMGITSITYYDAADQQQTLASSNYRLLTDELGPYVARLPDVTYPSVSTHREAAVSVLFTAGYGASASAVPASIREAMMLLVAHWYRNREAVVPAAMSDLPMGVQALLTPYRRRYV